MEWAFGHVKSGHDAGVPLVETGASGTSARSSALRGGDVSRDFLQERTLNTPFRTTLVPRSEPDCPESARAVLAATRERTGMIPNMYTRMANAPGLLQTYVDGYARFRAESGFSPAEQEVVLLSISQENGCEYCVAAHSTLADKASAVPVDVTDAIRDGAEVPHPALGALSEFTRHLVTTRGRPTRAAAEAYLAAGYSETQMLYVLLAIAAKTISNYTNHVFDTPLDAAFARRACQPLAASSSR